MKFYCVNEREVELTKANVWFLVRQQVYFCLPLNVLGTPGNVGQSGLPGDTGASGFNGATGQQGPTGAVGAPGLSGPQGR
jgi:Collagen triple helix repeat (20 copies)